MSLKHKRKIILYIAASTDGFIAKPGDDLSFLSIVEKDGEDYGYKSFLRRVDTFILGRKTYDWVMKAIGSFPDLQRKTYVLTKSDRKLNGDVIFYKDGIRKLIDELQSKKGKNIFLQGGAEVIKEFLQLSLIEEMIISIIPLTLGNGIRLFYNGIPEQIWKLKKLRATNPDLFSFFTESWDNIFIFRQKVSIL